MLEQTIDRLEEAHFNLHMMERFYHMADEFRWSLNSYLRTLKEVVQILSMELENRPKLRDWIRKEKSRLHSDPLIAHLSKTRDFVVHRGMLLPRSSGFVGIADSTGLEFGLNWHFKATQNSDDAMRSYLAMVDQFEDFSGVLFTTDSELPCVQREWKMNPFEENLLGLAAQAWQRVAQVVARCADQLGSNRHPAELDCLHDVEKVKIRLYTPAEVWKWYKELGGKLELEGG